MGRYGCRNRQYRSRITTLRLETDLREKPPLRFMVSTLMVIVCLSACAPDPAATQPNREQQKVFSEDDRRVAQALSLGGGIEAASKDPADEAARCVIALNFIRTRLSAFAGVNSEQKNALDRAIHLYRTRAGEKSAPSKEFAAKLKAAESAMPNQADQARASLRCLQALEKATPKDGAGAGA